MSCLARWIDSWTFSQLFGHKAQDSSYSSLDNLKIDDWDIQCVFINSNFTLAS